MENGLSLFRAKGGQAWVILLSLLAIAFLAAIDYMTGYEVSFSVFYVLPILFILWRSTVTAAIFISILSATVWGMLDVATGHPFSQAWIPVWNAVTRLVFFIIIVYLGASFRKVLEEEKQMARTDSLTGVANTRFFRECAEIELNRAGRFGRSFSLVYLDVDDFKKVNDALGHGRGDELLCCLSGVVKEQTRKYDLLARMGGDEFAVLLPETGADQARLVAEKILNAISVCRSRCGTSVTFSMGVVTYLNPPVSIDEAIKTADSLMYEVKKNGKNAVKYRVF